MHYGICISSRYLAEAQAAGYDFVELSMGELIPTQPETVYAPVREHLLTSPIPIAACNCFLPATVKVVGPAVELPAVRIYMDTALRRAGELGVSVVVFGSGGARRAPEGFPLDVARRQFAEAARLAAEMADPYGITIAIEPLNAAECNMITRVADGARLVTEIAHPRLQLLADSYHMLCEQEPYATLETLTRQLAHVHLDSIPLPSLPGGGEYEAPTFFHALARGGYQGRFSLEDHSNFLFNAEHGLPPVDTFSRQLAMIKLYWTEACGHL